MSPKPTSCASNPGKLVQGSTSFAVGDRCWTEEFNVIDLAAKMLGKRSHKLQSHDSWLTLTASGYILQPRLVEVTPRDDGSVQTLSTIEVSHPTLLPVPVFEFQHSLGPSVEESVTRGFEQWATVDLPVLLELPVSTPELCMEFMQELPNADNSEVRTRRLLLGPLQHDQAETETVQIGEHAASCPCCLLFKNAEAFAPLLEGDDFIALRLYALRSETGQALADCRINGVPWQPGKLALEQYVASWPGSGLMYRRQYVIAHTVTTVAV
ncbi:MAG: hypothetical protein JKY56_10565 [Kofleriaceae bacterium]|nr:hypothetical protein [Kofleriaceae bacterium]